MEARRLAAIVLEADFQAFLGARGKHARRAAPADGEELGDGLDGTGIGGRQSTGRRRGRCRRRRMSRLLPPKSVVGTPEPASCYPKRRGAGGWNIRSPDVLVLDDQHRLAVAPDGKRRHQIRFQLAGTFGVHREGVWQLIRRQPIDGAHAVRALWQPGEIERHEEGRLTLLHGARRQTLDAVPDQAEDRLGREAGARQSWS